MNQSSNVILLVKPSGFVFNTETADSNAFQNKIVQENLAEVVLQEFENFASTLQRNGIKTIVAEDTKLPVKPDAVFPNNWVSFHPDGTVILYPMMAVNRRAERRIDIIDSLKKEFKITKVIDLSHFEKENKFLEGTGSVVFDHINRKAYACLSPRTHQDVLNELCHLLNYTPVTFHSYDQTGKEIYHTNVMMCVGEKYTVICLDSITNEKEREKVVSSLNHGGHELINVSHAQIRRFAGNMLSVKNSEDENFLVMSQSAFDCLTPGQKQTLEKYAKLLPLTIPMIEGIGGGSARCMMAEIFLPIK